MKTKTRSKVPWINRCAIWVFTILLSAFILWFLTFVLSDVRSIKGPQYNEIRNKHVDAGDIEKLDELNKSIVDSSREFENQKSARKIVGDSSRNLQQTINQLLELRKAGIEKNVSFSKTEQADFASSMKLFLAHQKEYQKMNSSISDLLKKQNKINEEKRKLEEKINHQLAPAEKEYALLNNRHKLKLACFQLALLLPLLIIAVFLIFHKRKSIYFSIILAFGIATLLKVFMVMNDYFPKRYFKYILILAVILTIVRILIYFIRLLAYPKTQWLVRQYREAYERFLCPICEYPIRTGPRRFLFWNRRTVKKLFVPATDNSQEKLYTCPSCGTMLHEECTSCHRIRHSLLPYCDHCGAEKTISAE